MKPSHLLRKSNLPKPAHDAGFVYADGWHVQAFKDHCAERKSFALSDSEKLRLVEGSISRTDDDRFDSAIEKAKWNQNHQILKHNHSVAVERGENGAYDQIIEPDFKRENVPHNTPGAKAVIERRFWKGFDEFRIRAEVDTRQKVHAPEGARKSTELTRRAATKIADSCAFVAMERGGYSTFVTFTFSVPARLRLSAAGPFSTIDDQVQHAPVTIQKEVTRSISGFKRAYERGMKEDANGVEIPNGGIPANNDEFDYSWVVEIPKNEAGEDNPHVHLLMRWRVAYAQFDSWVGRLEKMWGHGTAHIEKIKDPLAAGAYLAKAAGYLTKGQDGGQGEVRGNRYGISTPARAPGWEKYSETQLHVMGQLLHDVYQHMTQKYGELYRERKRLNETRDRLLDDQKTAKAKGDTAAEKAIISCREKIGSKLFEVRGEIKDIPARSNQYQLVISGALNFHNFIHWATGKAEATGMERPDWLPEIPGTVRFKAGRTPTPMDAKDVHDLRKDRRHCEWQRNSMDDDELSFLSERWDSFKEAAMDGWGEYFSLGIPPMEIAV